MINLILKYNFKDKLNSFSFFFLIAYIPIDIILDNRNYIILLLIKFFIFLNFFIDYIYAQKTKLYYLTLLVIVLIIFCINNIFFYKEDSLIIFISGIWAYLALISYFSKYEVDNRFLIWVTFNLMLIIIYIFYDFYTNPSVRVLSDNINSNTLSLYAVSLFIFTFLSNSKNKKTYLIFLLCSIIIFFSNSRSGSILLLISSIIYFFNEKKVINLSLIIIAVFILNSNIDKRGGYEKFYNNQIESNNNKNNSRLEQSISGFQNFFNEDSFTLNFKKLIIGEAFGVSTNAYLNLKYKLEKNKINNLSTHYITLNSLIYNGGIILFIFFIKNILFYPHLRVFKNYDINSQIIFFLYLCVVGIISLTMPFNEAFPGNVIILVAAYNYFKKRIKS